MISRSSEPSRVYSYIRFSTPEQAMGDSERRQEEEAKRWCKRHGYQLDNQMIDRGKSGYHGHHRTKGALGDFLHEVQAGNIPTGSILLVENIDRLSREGALTVLRNIIGELWDRGITLQTLSPEETFEPGCDSDPKFLGLMFSMQRAQGESQRKSDLISKAKTRGIEEARNNGTPYTARIPAWLRTVGPNGEIVGADGKPIPAKKAERIEAIPEAKDTIKRIFQMKADGFSPYHIERVLTDDATWQRPNGWRKSYIVKILRNHAVIGLCQPHRRGKDGRRRPDGTPYNAYPPVIEPELFYSVQAQLESNQGKGGRTGKKRNIFTHLVKCGYCGGSMRYDPHGKKWIYFVCDKAKRGGGCRGDTVRYPEVVDVVLKGCIYLRPDQVLPNTDEHAARAAALRERREGAVAELQDIEQQRANFLDQLGRTNSPEERDEYQHMRATLAKRAKELEAAASEAAQELAQLEHGAKDTREWQQGVAGLMEAIKDDEASEMRTKLAAHLRAFIDRIEIFPAGFETAGVRRKHYHEERGEKQGRRRKPARRWWDPNVDTIAETLADAWDEMPKPRPTKKRWADFERYLLLRRMSKEGRFYRVHFKTGEQVDLVPEGGLATGFRVLKKSVERELPRIEQLWQEFEKGSRRHSG